jgi:hypothetical protein
VLNILTVLIYGTICYLDEETKADYKQFKQLLSINKHNRSDKPEITAINGILQKTLQDIAVK